MDHVLGPTGGSERDSRSKNLRLDLSPSRAEKHNEGAVGGEEKGALRGDASQPGSDGNGGRSVKKKRGDNGRGGDAEGSDERSAGVKSTRRGLPSHRGTSDSVAAERGEGSRRAEKNSDADAPVGDNASKGKYSLDPAKRGASRRRASRDHKPQQGGETKVVAEGSEGAAAAAVPRSRRRRSSASTTGDSGAEGDKRKQGKRLPYTKNETAKSETVSRNNSGGNGRRSQPTKNRGDKNIDGNCRKDEGGRRHRTSSDLSTTSRGGSSSLPSSAAPGVSRENSSRENEDEASQARSSTGKKGSRKRRQRLEEDGGGEIGSRSAGGSVVPRTRKQGDRRSVVAVDDEDDISGKNDIVIPDGGSTPGETSGKSGTSRGGGGGGSDRRTSRDRGGKGKQQQQVSEMDEVSGGWMWVIDYLTNVFFSREFSYCNVGTCAQGLFITAVNLHALVELLGP